MKNCFACPRLFAMPLAAFLSVCAFSSAQAFPANPEGKDVVQPDGTKFCLHLRGDEFFSWHETAEGFVVVNDPADGFWKYAQPATGRAAFVAIPTARVGSSDPAGLGLRQHAMPPPELVRALIEERHRTTLGRQEELPIPNTFTNKANKNAK